MNATNKMTNHEDFAALRKRVEILEQKFLIGSNPQRCDEILSGIMALGSFLLNNNVNLEKQKIALIVMVKRLTGISLADAKRIVEKLILNKEKQNDTESD